MAADDIVQLNITLNSKAPTAAGFGRTLICGYHTKWLGRTKLYSASSGLADMLTDGFLVTDQLYLLAQEVLSQKPAPQDFKIGRRALAFSQIVNLIPTVTTQGFVYSGTIEGVAWSYTVLAAATVATISTALATLLGGLGVGITASGASTTWCACTTTVAGNVVNYTNMVPELQIAEVTTDPGIATDLAAIYAADSDWFGMLLDSNSKAEVVAAAAFLETKRRVFFYPTADYQVKNPASTTDVMYVLKSVATFNTAGFYHHEVGSLLAAGALSLFLQTTPGSATLAHKLVIGVAPSDVAPNGSKWLTDAENQAVQAKNGNTYQTLGSQGDLYPGKVAGGDFVDNVRFIHFMYARIQEAFIGVLQSLAKLPMTDKGISYAVNVLQNLLNSWCISPYNALDGAPANAPTVTAPLLAAISTADRAARKLPNMQFQARLQGAIHLFQITGVVSV